MATPAQRVSFLLMACKRSAYAGLALSLCFGAAHAEAPQIRTSAANTVPGCVTPKRLMSFLKRRNHHLDPRFEGIAEWYRRHGEAWRVRWDYAFFQMAVETNFLTYKQGNGRWGDVNLRQNNFAGLGTTGGGVPGDSYPDVGTGVLAQIQHLVVYSGERIARPVGARTKLKQDDILDSMSDLSAPATFADLSRRWAVDRHYGASIEWVARSYRKAYCNNMAKADKREKTQTAAASAMAPAAALGGPRATEREVKAAPVRTIWSRATHTASAAPTKLRTTLHEQAPGAATSKQAHRPTPALAQSQPAPLSPKRILIAPRPVEVRRASKPARLAPVPLEPRAFAFAAAMNLALMGTSPAAASPAPQPIAPGKRCRVLTASYGGRKTLLVRAHAEDEVHYTALTVLDGFERSMLDSYVKTYAPGGASVGEFESKDAALAKARELCPEAAEAPAAEGASAG